MLKRINQSVPVTMANSNQSRGVLLLLFKLTQCRYGVQTEGGRGGGTRQIAQERIGPSGLQRGQTVYSARQASQVGRHLCGRLSRWPQSLYGVQRQGQECNTVLENTLHPLAKRVSIKGEK
jgi:hypothetical protein